MYCLFNWFLFYKTNIMLDYIKRISRKVLNLNYLLFEIQKQINDLNKKHTYSINEIKSYEIIKEYYPSKYFPITSFSVSSQLIHHILNDITINKPKRIIEFGSGISTIAINNFLEKEKISAEFISIDNSEEWQKNIEQYISNNHMVRFYSFDILDDPNDTNSFWYQIPLESNLRKLKYDLVLIDGPRSKTGVNTRSGAMKFLTDNLHRNSIIFIDDTDRSQEFELALGFSNVLGLDMESNLKYSRVGHNKDLISRPNSAL